MQHFISCIDYTVSRETFQIQECEICGFKFTNPVPDLEKLGDYYKSESYISHTDTKKGLVSKLYHLVRGHTLTKKRQLISKYVSRGTILDFGCGTGMFMENCKGHGWNAIGIEPSEEAVKLVKKKGLEVFSTITDLDNKRPNQKFDVITLWHVLEHVVELKQTMGFISKALKKQGVLLIAVPNHRSYDAVFYKQYWAAYDLPRHLYHFDKETLCSLASQFGFYLEQIHPMKFDSFYVSLLSENYISSHFRYLKAFYRGLVSNMKARSSGEFSSLIYVLRKK